MQARVLAAGLLADYDYSFLRYYGEEGVADVHRDGD